VVEDQILDYFRDGFGRVAAHSLEVLGHVCRQDDGESFHGFSGHGVAPLAFDDLFAGIRDRVKRFSGVYEGLPAVELKKSLLPQSAAMFQLVLIGLRGHSANEGAHSIMDEKSQTAANGSYATFRPKATSLPKGTNRPIMHEY